MPSVTTRWYGLVWPPRATKKASPAARAELRRSIGITRQAIVRVWIHVRPELVRSDRKVAATRYRQCTFCRHMVVGLPEANSLFADTSGFCQCLLGWERLTWADQLAHRFHAHSTEQLTPKVNTSRPVTRYLDQMEQMTDRIKAVRAALGITQTELGSAARVTKSAVSQWERGIAKPDRDALDEMEHSKYSINRRWITHGESPMVHEYPKSHSVSEPTANYKGDMVPVISWVRAGQCQPAADPYEPGDAEEWLNCPTTHGPGTFALRVRGDSMTAPHGRSYPDGTIIYVDPDKTPENGSRVIAKLDNEEVTFKELSMDAGRAFLRPLNTQYQALECDESTRIVGVVIGSYLPE